MMQRAPRVVQLSRRAVEAAAQTPAKRVHFAPLVGEVADATILEPIQNDPLLAPLTDAPDPDVPGVPEKYNYKERLPQSFPHGLPPSSLEPGATDQQYPPIYLFPDPPVGDGLKLLLETSLQAVSHLQDAVKNVQELKGELARSIWEKSTDTDRHFPHQTFPAGEEELIPAISAADILLVHITPVYLDTTTMMINVEGYVPKEAIIDTGAAKAMCSKKFATAVGVDMLQL